VLAGADPCRIAGCARAVLRDPAVAAWMGRRLDLYGDGHAGARIAAALAQALAPERAIAEPAAQARAA
jgi:UDP-N-acetylglucosamine 2-epimerase